MSFPLASNFQGLAAIKTLVLGYLGLSSGVVLFFTNNLYIANKLLLIFIFIWLTYFLFQRITKTQGTLQKSEQRFKKLYNATFEGSVIHDNGKIIECNQGFEELFGCTREELIGKDFQDFITQESWKSCYDQKNSCEVTGFNKKGDFFPLRLERKKIVCDAVEVELVEFRDISEEKKAQQKLHLAAKVFTYAREAIIITDTKGIILEANDAFTHITGYEKQEVLGKNPRILKSGKHDQEFYKKMWSDLEEKGHWYGEVHNRRKNNQIYVSLANIAAIKDETGKSSHYLSIFSDITILKEHEKRLEHMAHYDALTALPNRILFHDRLEQAIMNAKRSDAKVCVLYLDLDGFKGINDNYGHEVGDKLLISLSKKMQVALREGDTISRIGGDEFVIIMQNLVDEQSSIPVIERLLDTVSNEVNIEGIVLKVSASIGAAFYSEDKEIDADCLLRQSDQAMYKAKISGKNKYNFFDTAEDSNIRQHHKSLEEIKRGLEKNQFVLYYQPKINATQGTCVGFEALIRWREPAKGLLLPASFLPAVENDILELRIDEWVIQSALKQLALWQKKGFDTKVSVNVGAKQLQHSGFSEFVESALAKFPMVKPSNLEIEILESSIMEELSTVLSNIKACKKLGVTFALDDFGTGYSSLTYLKKFPVKSLKIDQSFIRDMLKDSSDYSIIEGVVGLSKVFKMKAIAEGVETQEHGVVLKKLGCELFQGYYISKPMPADKVFEWVENWTMDPVWASTATASSMQNSSPSSLIEHKALTEYLFGTA